MFGLSTRNRRLGNLVMDQLGNPIPSMLEPPKRPQSGIIGSLARSGGTPDLGMGSLVATPEQEAVTRALEQRFPNAPVPSDSGHLPKRAPAQQAMLQSRMAPHLPDSSSQPREIDPDVMKMIGQEPTAPKSFWRGGGKFRLEDGLAGILAALSDGLQQNYGGGGGNAVGNLIEGRSSGLGALEQARAAYFRNRQVAALPGMNAREFAAFQADPKAWGGNMSRASTSRYDAATLNPGDQRYLGEGGGVYQAPTRGQQYADSLGYEPGTDAYHDALRDQELGANGPTAWGNQQSMQATKDAQARYMEQMRQQGRMGLEGLRQGNRTTLRGQPTYRDLNPPPPRSGSAPRSSPRRQAARPTATGANGQTIYYDGKQWVDAQGRPVQ